MGDEKFFMEVMALFPDFNSFYNEQIEEWEDDVSTNYRVTICSRFIRDKIESGDTTHFPELFLLVENSLKDEKSSKELTNALCVSFLENLVNAFTEDEAALKTFVPLLGEESKDYIRGWDEFTGVKTPGV